MRIGVVGPLFLCGCLYSTFAWSSSHRPDAIEITPPRSTQDWKQMASLLVSQDAPSARNNRPLNSWWERSRTEALVLQRYTTMARKMKGNKYALWVAKSDSNVVGMVEMGLSSSSSERRSTVGVLTVEKSFRGRGIGRLLLDKCEGLCSSKSWNGEVLYAEVEPNNTGALAFFRRQGYQQEGKRTVVATVRHRQAYEDRLHLLLCKNLTESQEVESGTI